MRDIRQELKDLDTDHGINWKHTEGSMIVGHIVRYSRARGAHGEAWVCVVDDEEHGRVSVWLTPKVLIEQFRKWRPVPGERIGILCQGKDAEKGYWRFAMRVDRPGEGLVPDFEGLMVEKEEGND